MIIGGHRKAALDAWIVGTMRVDAPRLRAARVNMGAARAQAAPTPPDVADPADVDVTGAAQYDTLTTLDADAPGLGYGYDIPVDVPAQSPAPDLGMNQPQADLSPLGLARQPLGKKYVGEETGQGWQATRRAEGKRIKTEYFSDAEKEDNRLAIGPDGAVTLPSGAALTNREGFVMDPATGEMHRFAKPVRKIDDTVLHTHHSTPLAGGDVAGAGQIGFENGRIASISDQSGHYRPDASFTFQTVRQINMATLSDEIRAKLVKRPSTLTKAGGAAESPDTLEQLVAAEVGAARDKFFAELDEAEAAASVVMAAERKVMGERFDAAAAGAVALLRKQPASEMPSSTLETQTYGTVPQIAPDQLAKDIRAEMASRFAALRGKDEVDGRALLDASVEAVRARYDAGLDDAEIAAVEAMAIERRARANEFRAVAQAVAASLASDAVSPLVRPGPNDPAIRGAPGASLSTLDDDDSEDEVSDDEASDDEDEVPLVRRNRVDVTTETADTAGNYDTVEFVGDPSGNYDFVEFVGDPSGNYDTVEFVGDPAGNYDTVEFVEDPAGNYNNLVSDDPVAPVPTPASDRNPVQAPSKRAATPAMTKEAQVELLGKTGGLNEEDYLELQTKLRAVRRDPNATAADKEAALDEMRAEYNRISARNQLREPLGETAYAELVKNKGVERAMLEHGLQPGKAGSVAALKALLGKRAADETMADPEALQAAIAEFDIKSITTAAVDGGVEYMAMMTGQETEAKLTAQQFLQTGGNEAQIRNKARVTKQIEAGRAPEAAQPTSEVPKGEYFDYSPDQSAPGGDVESDEDSEPDPAERDGDDVPKGEYYDFDK